jgi:hypothetical protein
MRDLMSKMDDDKQMYGLPYKIIKKNFINLTPSASKGYFIPNLKLYFKL